MELNYYGYFTPFGGYGLANLNWVDNLSKWFDITVKLKSPLGDKERAEIKKSFPRVSDILNKPFKRSRIGIVESTPFSFSLNESDIKIANTMAETNKIAGSWVTESNKMDQIIVPSYFYREVFQKSGVTKPIKVIPHGVSDFWEYKKRPEKDVFVFGMCGYLNDRKGFKETVEAYANEFKENGQTELWLHTTNPETGYYKNWTRSDIKLTYGFWSLEQLREFYYSLDCFVFPSRAEGIGYPPREAMRTGVAPIVMDYSGLEDIANYTLNIKPAGFERVNPVAEQPGQWAKISITDLMREMRRAYEDKNSLGDLVSDLITNAYSWERSTKEMKLFLESL